MPAPPSSTSLLGKCYCCSPSSSPSPKQQAGGSRQPALYNLSSPRFLPRWSMVASRSLIRCVLGANSAGGARLLTRRAQVVSLLAGAVVAVTPAGHVRAEVKDDGSGGEGVVGAIKSLFDPNEETKAGKVLPKAYLKSAREVVRTLRESLEEDAGGDVAKFRRGADSAKASIREFLGSWRGQQAVAKEESYVALERAIRSLAEFYSKAGPFASLPPDVKNKILDDLSAADAYL